MLAASLFRTNTSRFFTALDKYAEQKAVLKKRAVVASAFAAPPF